MRLFWSWHYLCLARLDRQTGFWLELFALRCALCRRFTWGCRDGWFCGLCEPCRRSLESDE